MSKEVDERVVSMQFDNAQFEANIKSTIKSLQELDRNLQMKNASTGLDTVATSMKKVDVSPLSNGIEAVKVKFSALQVAATTALANITNQAVNAGKRLISSFTIDPIKTGFSEYETQINAVQTILANTKSKGTTLDQVNEALDELNTYADKTIYNFTQMTKNIGTFTAAGIGLEDSTKAIQGIANLAAVSGSTSQQASTAMYQLSQALSAGTLKVQDWNSVVTAGMGGQVFQDALKKTAKAHGVAVDEIIEKNGSFRESLSEGWITSEILTETLSKMTKTGAAEYLSNLTGISKDQIEATQKLVAENKDGTASYEELAESIANTGKISKEDVIELLSMADTAEDAATKVKTFTQLMDTLKEAAQSGWTQSWELIVGDFEQAKELWTKVSDTMSNIINESATARNEIIKGWSENGGRDAAINSIENIFKAVMNVIKPIKEAFNDIFPQKTAEQWVSIAKSIENFTAKLILSEEQMAKVKETFKGIFSVAKIFANIFKEIIKFIINVASNFKGLGSTLLDFAASIGSALIKLNEFLQTTNPIQKALNKISDIITIIINKIKEIGIAISKIIKFPTLETFLNIMSKIKNVITKIGSIFKKVTSSIVSAFKQIVRFGEPVYNILTFGNSSIGLLDVLNAGFFGALLLGLKSFVSASKEAVKSLTSGINSLKAIPNSIVEILNSVKGCFVAFQKDIQANTLRKIAISIAILAGSLFLLATIKPEKLSFAIGAITGLFTELIGSFAAFKKVTGDSKGLQKTARSLIPLAISILILSSALKKISKIDTEKIAPSILALASICGILIGVSKALSTSTDPRNSKRIMKGALGLIFFAVAVNILASACKKLAQLSWGGIVKGLFAVGVLMGEIVLFTKTAKMSLKMVPTAIGIVIIASALKILASACKDLGSMDLKTLGKGLLSIQILLVDFMAVTAMAKESKKMISTGMALVIIAASLKIVASACKDFGSMDLKTLAKGLIAIGTTLVGFILLANATTNVNKLVSTGIALVIIAASLKIVASACKDFGSMDLKTLAKGLIAITAVLIDFILATNAMNKNIAGAVSVLILTVALKGLAAVIEKIGNLEWRSIIKSLVSLAAVFTIVGIASMLLKGSVPVMLGLSAAILLLGAGCVAAGVGLSLIAVGITALAMALASGVAAIAASIGVLVTSFADLIPYIMKKFGEGIVALCKSISDGAVAIYDAIKTVLIQVIKVLTELIPMAVDGVLEFICKILEALVKYAPKIVNYIFDFIIKVLDVLSSRLPELVKSLVNVLMSLFTGVVDALKDVDMNILMQGFVGIGLLSSMMAALAAAAALTPAAALGAVGIVGVLAEIGGLAKIPGLQWLIKNGSGLLEAIGDAVGSFAGGIVSGFMNGVSSGLPDIGEDLSKFMDKMSGFIEGSKTIDKKVIEGVGYLAGAIIAISAAEIINGIASFIAGSSSMKKFGDQLKPFGEAMVEFSSIISGKIDSSAVKAASNAGAMMADMAKTIPNSGGVVGFFAGENDLDSFAEQLVPFGKAITDFSEIVSGKIDESSIEAAANAGIIMTKMADTIPNTGGLVSWFAGDNDMATFGEQLVPFGEALAKFSESVKGIDEAAVEAASNAGIAMTKMADTIPNTGGLVSWFTGDNDMATFGEQLVSFGESISKFSDSVKGIDESAVTTAANVGTMMTGMANTIPNSGGVVSWFTGDNGMDTFGEQLVPFGEAMGKFSDSISGIDESAVTAAASAGQALASMSETIPNTGGLVSLFAGDTDMVSFGDSLSNLGVGIKAFSDAMTADGGIDLDAVDIGSSAAKKLGEMAASIPTEGGILDKILGSSDPKTFGDQMAAFGESLATFAQNVSGISGSEQDVNKALEVGKSMVDIANEIPEAGGLLQKFVGGIDIGTFGGQIGAFGEGIKTFADNVNGLSNKKEDADSAVDIGTKLVKLADNLPDTGASFKAFFCGNKDSLSTFGDNVGDFGTGLQAYCNAIGTINIGAVNAGTSAAQSLANIAAMGNDIIDFFVRDTDTYTKFKDGLFDFGIGIKGYAGAMHDIDFSTIYKSIDVGDKMGEMVNGLPKNGGIFSAFTGTSDLGTFSTNLTNFGTAIVSYANEVNGLEEGAVTKAKSAGDVILALADAVPKSGGIVDFFTGTSDLATISTDIPKFGEAINSFATQVCSISDGVVESGAAAGSALISMYKEIPKDGGLKEWISGGASDLTTMGSKLVDFSKSIKDFSVNACGVSTVSIQNGVSSGRSLFDFYRTLVKADISYFDSIPDMSKMTDIATIIKDFSSSTIGIDPLEVQNASESGKKIIDLAKYILTRDIAFDSIFNDADMVSFKSDLKIFGEAIADYANAVTGINTVDATGASVAAATILNAIGNIDNVSEIETIAAKLPEFGESLKSLTNAVTDLNYELLTENSSAILKMADNLNMAGSLGVERFIGAFKNSESEVTLTISEMLNKARTSITSQNASFMTASRNLVTSFCNGIKSYKSMPTVDFSNLCVSCVDIITNAKTNFESAGKDLVRGFSLGITEQTFQAEATASAMAGAALTAAKEKLKEHSPSKASYKIGDYYVLGFINAIKDGTSKVYNYSGNMADTAKRGLSLALDKINELASSDSRMTISPVLDLSDISSGLNQIDGMFGKLSPTVGPSMALSGINEMMTVKSQNGINDDVVSAINKLGDNLNSTSGNSYTINGITYDDGSAISDAVKSLIQAARIERRR